MSLEWTARDTICRSLFVSYHMSTIKSARPLSSMLSVERSAAIGGFLDRLSLSGICLRHAGLAGQPLATTYANAQRPARAVAHARAPLAKDL